MNDAFHSSTAGVAPASAAAPGAGPQPPAGAAPRPIHPALQLLILLAPVVLNGFFLIYALVGLVLEGDSMLRWSDEALGVSLWLTLVNLGYSLFEFLLARWRRLPLRCLLNISAGGHLLLALLLTAMVARLV